MKICLVCEGISDTEQERCASCELPLVDHGEVHFPVRRGEADAAHPLQGAVIDSKYRITGVVGKGGMGTVFAAVHEVSLMPVALKILHARHATRSELKRSFLEEGRKAGRVNHEHSARVLDVGEDRDGTIYIAMELVEGVTLDEWIHTGEGMSAGEVVEILLQISQALAAAHGAGVVHRDLSPRNVLCVVRGGRPAVKILDFGISKEPVMHDREAARMTSAFANPPYSAPEHLTGQDVDGRADLYSLGVVAYEALSGEIPVTGQTRQELGKATVEGRVRPLRPPPGTPRRLVRLVQRMLALDPADRPPNAEEVIRELHRIRNPRGLLLRTAAVSSLALALPGFILAHTDAPPEPDLEAAESALVLLKTRPGPDDPAQERTTFALDTLSLRYFGFDGGALRLTAYAEDLRGEPLAVATPALDPVSDTVRFERAKNTSYSELLRALAERAAPAVLVFEAEGIPRLRYAKVLVDDTPPEIALTVERDGAPLPDGGVIHGETRLRYAVRDLGASTAELLVRWDGSGDIELPVEVDVDGEQRTGTWFADHVPDHLPVHNVELELQARDAAGNRATSVVHRFATMDLAAPAVESVTGRRSRSVLTWSAGGVPPMARARMQVELDRDPEADLQLLVRGDAGVQWDLPWTADPALEAAVTPGADPFGDGRYTFSMRDAAGNESEPLVVRLLFRNELPEVAFRVRTNGDGGAAPAAVLELPNGPALVIAEHQVDVDLQFTEVYRLTRATLRPTGGATTPADVDIAAPANGAASVTLPADLPAGRHQLELVLLDEQDDERRETFPLHVLREPMRVRVGAGRAERRFLLELIESDVLARVGAGRSLRPGPAWSVTGGAPELLQGNVWFGRETQESQRPWESRGGGDQPWFELGEVLNGWNVLALDLRDALGRPVEVLLEGRAALTVRLGTEGQSAQLVARFFHTDRPPALTTESIAVEPDQPPRVILRTSWPFRPQDELSLAARSSLRAVQVDTQGAEVVLSATLDYRSTIEAMGLLDRFEENRRDTLAAKLRTPAGTFDYELPLLTIRSTLRVRRLDQLAPAAALPPTLHQLIMVPVLGPPDGKFPDPVPSDAPRRGAFRTQPHLDEVRSVADVYLQDRELSRAQYAALATALQQDPPSDEVKATLVHTWDPMGVARLDALLPPHAYADADAAWHKGLAAAPERPVTGVSFFQAYTACRIAGHLYGGDPELFRLPTGVELELAALGPRPSSATRNGAAATGTPPGPRLLELARLQGRLGQWPPTHEEALSLGDGVLAEAHDGGSQHAISGLDFGALEWVLDLPCGAPGSPGREVILTWLRDHEDLLERALGQRQVTGMAALEVAPKGVVRGATALDVGRWLGPAKSAGPLPTSVPGVVRSLVLLRTGNGLDAVDWRLPHVGFRLAGGARFIREVRR
ncbi:MAG: serine/threonine-protein kinase [Planctomycetota bacterium]